MSSSRALLVIAAVLAISSGAAGAVVYDRKVEGPPRTGRFRESLLDKENRVIVEFYARVPQALPAKPHLGLIFSFYGVGGGKDDDWDQGNPPHHIRELGWSDQYIFVSPRSKGSGWSMGADADAVTKLMDWFLQNYPIDQRRIYLYGFSSGGFFAGPYAVSRPEVIAGAFCSAGNVTGMKRVYNPADTAQEFYLLCGTDDGHKSASRKSNVSLRGMGYRVIYREIEGLNHNNITSHDPSQKDAFSWIHALRHKTRALSEEDGALVARFLAAESAIELWRGPDTAAELARIGGPQASAVIIKALQSGDGPTVRAAAEVCSKVMFDSKVVRSLAAIHSKGSPEEARKAVIGALSFLANFRFEEAQAALCRSAIDRRIDAAWRVEALRGIGRAARMQAFGSFDDQILFETLTVCLTDKDAGIRQAAFEALSPAVTGGYGFDPQADPRTRQNMMALQQWAQWFGEKFTRR